MTPTEPVWWEPRGFLRVCAAFTIGLGGQLLSFALWVRPAGVSSIWVPGGLFLALLLLSPRRMWPALCAGLALGGALAFYLRDGRFTPAFFGYVWMAACLVATARFVHLSSRGHTIFGSVADLFRYFLIAVIAMPAVSSLGAVLVLIAAGGRARLPDTWILVAPGHAASYALLTPLVVGFVRFLQREPAARRKEMKALAQVFAVQFALGGLVWWLTPPSINNLPLLLFTPVPVLLVSVMRLGSMGASAALLASIIPAAWAALYTDSHSNFGAHYVSATFMQLWAVAAAFLVQALVIQGQQTRQGRRQLQIAASENQLLAEQIMKGQEEERARIARELHDDINQRMALAAFRLGNLRFDGSDSDGQACELVRRSLLDLMDDVRKISHNLHPTTLQYVGLQNSLQALAHEMRQRWHGVLEIDLDTAGFSPPADVAISLYRIAQEALGNAIAHSDASTIRIVLRMRAQSFIMEVEDDGVGFDPDAGNHRPGLGMLSMRERARQQGGVLSVDSAPWNGTRVCVTIPIG